MVIFVLQASWHGDRPVRLLCLRLQPLLVQSSRRGRFLLPAGAPRSTCVLQGLHQRRHNRAETRERAVGTALTTSADTPSRRAEQNTREGREVGHSNTNKTSTLHQSTGAQQKAARPPDDHNTQLLMTAKYRNSKIERFSVHYRDRRDGTSLVNGVYSTEGLRGPEPPPVGLQTNLLQLPLFWTVARQLARALISHSPKITAWSDTFSGK